MGRRPIQLAPTTPITKEISMHLTTTKKTTAAALAAAAIWAAPLAPAQDADGQEAARAARVLAGLIDPAAPGAQQSDTPSSDEMKRVVRELIDSGNGSRVQVFGESAGPALRAIVAEADLRLLTRPDSANPLYHFVQYAPLEALQFFSDMERDGKFKYEAIVRGEFGPMYLIGSAATNGASRALFLDLMDRTIASEGLSLNQRLEFAVGALNDDLATEASRKLIRENADLAIAVEDGAWADLVVGILHPDGVVPSPDVSMTVASAVLRYRPGIENYAILASSPFASIRREVAVALEDKWSALSLPTDRVTAILAELSKDPDPRVAGQSDQAIEGILSMDKFRVDLAMLAELIPAVGARSDLSESLAQRLTNSVHRTVQESPNAAPEMVQRIYGAIFDAPNSRLQLWLRQTSRPSVTVDHAIAYFTASARSSSESRKFALQTATGALARTDARSSRRAAATLDLLMNDAMRDEDELPFLEQTSFMGGSVGDIKNGKPQRRGILTALPPERVPEAVRWLADAGSLFDSIAFTSSAAWKDAGPQLRALMSAPASTNRQRLLAGSALIMSGAGTEEDAGAFAQILIDLSATPSARQDVLWFLEYRGHGSVINSPTIWNDVFLALLESDRVPAEIANELSLTGIPKTAREKATSRAVLVAAERRAAAASPPLEFKNLAYFGLRAMIDDPSLVQPTLLRSWISLGDSFTSEAVTVVLATGDQKWIEESMTRLLTKLASATGAYYQRPIADQLLRLPGDEPVQRLLEFVMRSGSTDLVTHVEQRVAELVRIREASLRWSQLASGGADVDTAKARVLLLLDSPSKDVRIEAIRGLGTLGAIEALPRLIELVGSADAGERQAAKDTLELLRQRAARQVPAEDGASSGR